MFIDKLLGVCGGLCSVVIYIIVCFFNPTEMLNWGTITILLFMLFIPGCLAVFSAIARRRGLMLISIVWLIPVALYFSGGNGVYRYTWIIIVLLSVSFILMNFKKPTTHSR
ncbi:hypothetical protein PVOR_29489 [Paenibacillus vortex V453]|jgi:hypothetical protein|uniref:Uncharacterized protein n=2 Tax=Paenibacillus TaxID=44249 RepID=A0A163H4Z6_9BACL|nr:hypothetical protein A3958_04925 [Paenibacillus glucanolyticus]AWP25841.1 hypothetical protein B9D94_04060 [Paenibacillus sp. Cedars]EFU38528.1 hypothetical protein PVOR_29489 [Paenibacillus vortex V453]ETT29782.1 hypothetical protein C169_29132 [Paenibacillus sp. FSL R5-808]MDH6673427.1 hypothetical protein [Paenibacillus sp. LBL]